MNNPIDLTSFRATDIVVEGPLGTIPVGSFAPVGDRAYQMDFASQAEDGYYHFTVLPTLLDAEGFELDQNANGVPGEIEDFYEFTLILDTVAPRVTHHTPAGDLAGTIDHIDIWFSEAADQWDINDPLLTTVEHTGGLTQDEVYSQAGIGYLPGVLPGDHYIIVRADAYNQEQEQEAGGEGNNVLASGPFPLDVRVLANDGTSASGELSPDDRADYYAIDVAPGDSLRLFLDGQAAAGSNELYVSYESIPTWLGYDFRAAGGQDQELLFTADAAGGTYYILAYGAQIDTSTPYELTAETGPVFLADITPDHHGDAQPVTVTVTGAGFDPDTHVEFVASDGSVQFPTGWSCPETSAPSAGTRFGRIPQ